MKYEQEYLQMTESILAQKDKPIFDKQELRKLGGDVLRGLGAAAFITLSLPNIGNGIDAQYDASQSREFAHTQEQSGNSEGAKLANDDAEAFETARNMHLGLAGAQLGVAAANISVLALNRRKRRTQEVIISGEKPTEQPKN